MIIVRLLIAALLVGLALRVYMTGRRRPGSRPVGEWLYIAAMLLMAIPLLVGQGLIFLSILGVLLLIGAQVLAGWNQSRGQK